MGKTLEESVTTTHVADVVHHGEKIILPEDMKLESAIDVLLRRRKYLQQEVNISEDFNVFPWDGAYALSQVMIEKYGWAEGRPIQTMFGEIKPSIIKVATGPGQKSDIAWGQFSIPHVEATLDTGYTKRSDGRIIFQLSATVKRVDEQQIRDLFSAVGEYLKTNSLYRGKAIKLRFRDEDGDRLPLPEPEFIDTRDTNIDGLIFSDDLMTSIKANLFTPITRVQDCLNNGVKVKRGILLGGKYGTGKTLAASVAARLAVDHDVTYVYAPRAEELSDAIDFAKQYQSPACVVFCEDIDRSITGKRSVKMDDVLNILDGIDTKNDNIITVLTTNHLTHINKAMLRPGRLDAIINVTPPDARAAEKLVRLYGGVAIADHEDLSEVGLLLEGQIPAVIEETVKRAKLFQLSLIDRGAAITGITAEALRQASSTMKTQIELLEENKEVEQDTLGTAMLKVVKEGVSKTA